ncbi:MAG: hypothetical protein WBB24_12245 [Maribacter sp.]
MTDNIKRLYGQMDESTKHKALRCLSSEFTIGDGCYIDELSIKTGSIPEPYQESVVVLFQNLLRKKSIVA